jgi:uncharacterized protein YkwD
VRACREDPGPPRGGPVLTLLLALWLPVNAQGQAKPDLSRVEALVIEGTNDFRRQEHRPQVERDDKLEKAARDFAMLLARTGEFGHEAGGSTPSERARRHGYDFCIISENIAYQYSSAGFQTPELARKLVEGWKNSPGHRKNMLAPDVTDTAVAVAHSAAKGLQRYYAVQMFGRPRSASVEFEVGNATQDPVKYRVGDRAFVLQPRIVQTHRECTPQTLVFELPEDANSPAPQFTTRNRDKFVVAREKGRLSVKRE